MDLMLTLTLTPSIWPPQITAATEILTMDSSSDTEWKEGSLLVLPGGVATAGANQGEWLQTEGWR